MTPHVWICDEGEISTLFVDMVADDLRSHNVELNVIFSNHQNSNNSVSILQRTVSPNEFGFHRIDIEVTFHKFFIYFILFLLLRAKTDH